MGVVSAMRPWWRARAALPRVNLRFLTQIKAQDASTCFCPRDGTEDHPMYRHVLVPIALDHGEGTQTAIAVARHLADAGGQITALTVLEPVPTFIANELPEGQIERTSIDVMSALREEMGEAVDIRPVVIMGHPGRAIVDFAEENGVDCIVVASHKPGLADYFLGSTAARVVRHARCPVHVVR
jgi:nucleotide-binding universal stress UspA family protein